MKTLNVTLDGFTDWSEILYQLPDPKTISEKDVVININYTCGDYLDCHVYPILLSYYNALKERGFNVIAQFDTQQKCSTVNYAGRIHFFQQMGIPYQYPFNEHDPGGRFIPLTIVDNTYGLPIDFLNSLCERLDITEEIKNAFSFTVDEIICNINQHANINLGGVIYAQSFPKEGRVILTIVDHGIGVYQSFQKSANPAHKLWTEKECLLKCLDKDVTSGNGMGQGLFLIRQIISSNLGELRLISGNHNSSIVNGHLNANPSYFWQGVILMLEFNLNNKVVMNDVFTANGYESNGGLW